MALKALTPQKLCERHTKLATDTDAHWQSEIRDVHRYVMPYREAIKGRTGDQNPGNKRGQYVYDATAVAAGYRGAGKLKRALIPDDQQFFRLNPGPMLDMSGDGLAKETLKKRLEATTRIAWTAIQGSNFSVAGSEMCLDLYGGMGALFIEKGDEHDLIRFEALPADQVVVDRGKGGDIRRWFYVDRMPADQVEERWPEGNIPDELAKIIAKDGNEEVEVLLSCERLGAHKFVYSATYKPSKSTIHSEPTRTSPFVTPRFFVVPGEGRGRGLPSLAMPSIKTANKTVEMQLRAAAFSLLPAFASADDGEYNPRTSNIVPGGMVKVRSNGGPRGESLKRLPIPADTFDLSGLILSDLRAQIREILHDVTMPQNNDAVKSPTEILAKLQRLAEDQAAAFGRLSRELIVPIVQRVIDILEQWDLLPEFTEIDQFVVALQVLSPLADNQALEDIQKCIRWIELLQSTIGPEATMRYLHDERFALMVHERLGCASEIARTSKERDAFDKMKAAAMAAQQMEGGAAT